MSFQGFLANCGTGGAEGCNRLSRHGFLVLEASSSFSRASTRRTGYRRFSARSSSSASRSRACSPGDLEFTPQASVRLHIDARLDTGAPSHGCRVRRSAAPDLRLVRRSSVQQWRAPVHATAQDGTVPIVIIMTPLRHTASTTRMRVTTVAPTQTLLSETLRDLPIVLHKETSVRSGTAKTDHQAGPGPDPDPSILAVFIR